MPLDSICLTAVRNELAEKLVGLKADKIQQPERDQILLTMRGFGRAEKLLICAGTGDARLHLTDYAFENPAQPPMFCMLLRKHTAGGKAPSITQPPMERLVDLSFSGYDAMGWETEKHLIVELLGRFSNIILTDATGSSWTVCAGWTGPCPTRDRSCLAFCTGCRRARTSGIC
jgi:predicted ribosome quality control (RQC) complex YloA/Tae2 family protein